MIEPRIKIAGAGPAGLAAAISLAREGYGVTVLERAASAGARFIGGFQILENYTRREDVLATLMRNGIEPDFVIRAATDVTYYDADLRPYPVKSSKPFGYFVRRGPGPGTLDTGLLRQAQKAGVEILFGRHVAPREVDIVATGPRTADGLAREIVFKTDLPDGFRVILDRKLTRDGFAYLFVIGGQATLGLATLSEFGSLGSRTNAAMDRFQELGRFAVEEAVAKSSHISFYIQAPSDRRPIYAGEAAGFQDFLFGIGIRRSIESGVEAARSIAGLDNGARRSDLAGYMDMSVLNRLFFELSALARFRPFLALMSRFDLRRFGRFLTKPGPIRKLAAGAVKSVWKNRADCRHGPMCIWCRRSR